MNHTHGPRGALTVVALVLATLSCSNEPRGQIEDVFLQEATVDGQVATNGQQLRVGSRLETNDTGSVRFLLQDLNCAMERNSEVFVPDEAGTDLRYARGKTWCSSETRGTQELDAQHTRIRVTGTLFAVAVDERGALVQVVEGEVELRSLTDGARLRVAARQQAEVRQGQLPARTDVFSPERLGPDALGLLGRLRPEENSAGKSPLEPTESATSTPADLSPSREEPNVTEGRTPTERVTQTDSQPPTERETQSGGGSPTEGGTPPERAQEPDEAAS